MPRTLNEAIPDLCLALPDVEQFESHGAPNFRVRGGKVFAIYALNHHGDGRVALWLKAPPGAQDHLAGDERGHYFVPPYVGPRGWLGVILDRGLSWAEIGQRLREAHAEAAPRSLRAAAAGAAAVAPPDTALSPEQIDPLQSAHAQQVLAELRRRCLALPETAEDRQFGAPVWRAGKKTFASAYAYRGPLMLSFWVGVERQSLMAMDPRFHVPAYMGHNGWIALDVSKVVDWPEISALLEDSYRHFALRRMLLALDRTRG
jgi:predicted DNA-binding protein (MmcQ/YjbR family)